MSLIVGDSLDPKKYFSEGKCNPKIRRSSLELTIGTIFDHEGNAVSGVDLHPNEMVQVISAEEFNLPNNVTGHLTVKARFTKKGIWALATGLVDPGWDGPISSSLINFSKQTHKIRLGQVFLRVTLFEHTEVQVLPEDKVGSVDEYKVYAQESAVNVFPRTFLDQPRLAQDAAKEASEEAYKKIMGEFNNWAKTIIAILALIIAIPRIWDWIMPNNTATVRAASEISLLHAQVDDLEKRLYNLQMSGNAPNTKNLKQQQQPTQPSPQPAGQMPNNTATVRAASEISRLHTQVDALEKRLYMMQMSGNAPNKTNLKQQQPPAQPSHKP